MPEATPPPHPTHADDPTPSPPPPLLRGTGLIERGELKSSLVDVATVEAVVLQLTRDEEDLHQVRERERTGTPTSGRVCLSDTAPLALLPSPQNTPLQESIAVMDAFSQPKMAYDPHSKSFSFSFDSKRPMNPPASARCVQTRLETPPPNE